MTAFTPPLLAAMSGAKPRARRAHIPAPKEAVLHFGVAKLLRDHCLPTWRWTHIGHGEKRDIRTATKLMQLGQQKGWPDFLFISPDGRVHCLELKRLGSDLSFDQEKFQIWCVSHGVPYIVCRTMEQVLFAFEHWGCLRIQFTPRREE